MTVSRLTFVAVIALASTACYGSTLEYDLPVDADLTAVRQISHGWIAVGTSGTVVTWSTDKPAFKRRFVRTTDLGDEDLHAIDYSQATGNQLVIGDGGVAALSSDFGASWVPLELGVDADLHAIVNWNINRTLILGDDVVLREQADGTWTELPPPVGGWGQLRAGVVAGPYGPTHIFVGLEGVVWVNEDPLDPANPWIAEDPGTNADLFGVSTISGEESLDVMVAGADGTLMRRKFDGSYGWTLVDPEIVITSDIISYHDDMMLTAEGEVFFVADWDFTDEQIEVSSGGTYPGALGFMNSEYYTAIAGPDGVVTTINHPQLDDY